MFILDTNVLSAMMGSRPVPEVANWMAGQAEESLFTSTISEAEILAGIAVLPDGRRRSGLEMAAAAMFRDDFAGRILAFDSDAAEAYAGLFAARKRDGRPTTPLDLMIAAIAHAKGATVVTRDTGGFDDVFFHNGRYTTLRQVMDFYNDRDVDPGRIYPRGPNGRTEKYDDIPAAFRDNVDTSDPPLSAIRANRRR